MLKNLKAFEEALHCLLLTSAIITQSIVSALAGAIWHRNVIVPHVAALAWASACRQRIWLTYWASILLHYALDTAPAHQVIACCQHFRQLAEDVSDLQSCI